MDRWLYCLELGVDHSGGSQYNPGGILGSTVCVLYAYLEGPRVTNWLAVPPLRMAQSRIWQIASGKVRLGVHRPGLVDGGAGGGASPGKPSCSGESRFVPIYEQGERMCAPKDSIAARRRRKGWELEGRRLCMHGGGSQLFVVPGRRDQLCYGTISTSLLAGTGH